MDRGGGLVSTKGAVSSMCRGYVTLVYLIPQANEETNSFSLLFPLSLSSSPPSLPLSLSLSLSAYTVYNTPAPSLKLLIIIKLGMADLLP